MKNPFSFLTSTVQNKIKTTIVAMYAKFRSESDTLKIELSICKSELKQVKGQVVISEDKNKLLIEENIVLAGRAIESKKALFFLQSTSSNIAKVQKLIEAYTRIKIELLELRKICDCSANYSSRLQQEIDRQALLSASLTGDCRIDVNSLVGTIEILKKDLSQCRCKNESLERLVANIKKHEQKLVNYIRSKQVL